MKQADKFYLIEHCRTNVFRATDFHEFDHLNHKNISDKIQKCREFSRVERPVLPDMDLTNEQTYPTNLSYISLRNQSPMFMTNFSRYHAVRYKFFISHLLYSLTLQKFLSISLVVIVANARQLVQNIMTGLVKVIHVARSQWNWKLYVPQFCRAECWNCHSITTISCKNFHISRHTFQCWSGMGHAKVKVMHKHCVKKVLTRTIRTKNIYSPYNLTSFPQMRNVDD